MTVPTPSSPSVSSGSRGASGLRLVSLQLRPLGGRSSGQLINVLAEKGKAPVGAPKDNHRPLGGCWGTLTSRIRPSGGRKPGS